MADADAPSADAPPIEAPSVDARDPASPPPLRVWPAVLLVAAMWGFLTLPNALMPESPRAFMLVMPGMFVCFVLIGAWWLFASRAPWLDRLIGVAVFAGGLALGANALYHPSIMGKPFPVALIFFVTPWLFTLAVAAVLVSKPLGWRAGRWVTLAVVALSLTAPALLAYEGANSGFEARFRSRWAPSKEEELLASLGPAATAGPTAAKPEEGAAADAPRPGAADWPGFRGPNRDGHTAGGALGGDWRAAPPRELWRRPVGPGWGSFCVVAGVAYTQEQRGEQDCVVAYDASTGDQLWSTGVEARFEESIAGPGPRGTPTYHEGDLYTTGGDGDVQRLDASTGEVRWRRNLVDDGPRQSPPDWGYASSPLIVGLDDGRTLVVVLANNPKPDPEAAAPPSGKGVIAYDADSGEPVWSSGAGFHSYSSAHLATLGGVQQVLMWTNVGLESLDPATGERLWFFDWEIGEFPRCTQPLVVDGETLVLSAGYDSGTLPIHVTKSDDGWRTEELWDRPSQALVPYFNDIVAHRGRLYGISKKFLTCVDLETGKATWPRRVKRQAQVGNGQLVLDPQSGVLLVTTEDTGEVLLVEANPETLVVLGRFQALNPERNWNHPVVAGGRLYVRHGSEAACYQLPAPAVASR